jgi:hypothetical protein
VGNADGWFFTFCFAVLMAILWYICSRLSRIEEKIDKMRGK